MSPRPSPLPTIDGAAPARGFVLVGVAMFVLVLTILGLSLFSLSGFEAQFFARSNERSEAFNAAASGLERARFALLATDSLQVVWQRLPGDGLEYAVALQGPDPTSGDTTGLVEWNGEDIWIRAVARKGVARVVLQARFNPREPEEFYKRLITARRVDVEKSGPPPTIYLSGAVMQSDSDTSWNRPPDAPLSSPLPRPPIEFHDDPLPLPDLDSYFAARMPLTKPYGLDEALGHYTLDAGLGGVGYFHRPPTKADWSVDEKESNPSITVIGTAVWLADPGIKFNKKVQVLGDPLTARLIIVGRPKDHSEIREAIEFKGGIISDVPMILVSDGKVRFDSKPSYDDSTRVAYLSIYAGRVQIAGPENLGFPPPRMDLMHTASLLPNQAEPIIDQLYLLNVLPNSGAGTQGRLTLVPGTWQERSASTTN